MKKVILILIGLVLTFVLSGCDFMPWQLEDEATMQTNLMDARSTGREGTVGIQVRLSNDSITPSGEVNSYGSAVVFFKGETYYYILTNFHVIDRQDYDHAKYTIHTKTGEETNAELVYSDKAYDLAMLRFEINDLALGPINIDARLNRSLSRGEMLLAIGYPSEVPGVVTYGEYIGMSRTDKVAFDVLTHSALIFPGNSGGPLIDLNGNLVGVNTWTSTEYEERYLAIPLKNIHDFIDDSGRFTRD